MKSSWHSENLHMVDGVLVKVWRHHLSMKERYSLWYLLFTSAERVRLWNRLVFSRDWFRRTINFSKRRKPSDTKEEDNT